jgi:Tol biopolymer transport system component
MTLRGLANGKKRLVWPASLLPSLVCVALGASVGLSANSEVSDSRVVYALYWSQTAPFANWLATARLDGSDMRFLTARPHGGYRRYEDDMALSPDGSQVAFVRNTDGGNALFVISIESGAIRRLVGAAQVGRELAGPRWSPDGQTIAFAGHDCTHSPRLFTIGADGSQPRRLQAIPAASRLVWIEPQGWSPDGRKLLYDASRWYDDCGRFSQFDSDSLYVINADGSDPMRLPGVRSGWGVDSAAWSPTGLNVVMTTFSETDDYESNPKNCSLSLIALDSDAVRTLTRSCAVLGFVWDPSGSSVIIGTLSTIGRVDVQTGRRSIILRTRPSECCWISADGQLVAFALQSGSPRAIWSTVLAVNSDGVVVARLRSPKRTRIVSLDIRLG